MSTDIHVQVLYFKSKSQDGNRQKRQKIAQIQEFAHATGEPCMSSYGIVPTAINAVSDSGDSIAILLSDSTPSTSASRQLTDQTAANTLFLLDRFCCFDELYHELAQVHRCIIISIIRNQVHELNSGISGYTM